MSTRILIPAALLALAVGASVSSAQSTKPKKVHVVARAGLYAPLSDLFGSYDGAYRSWRTDAYPSLGLGAELGLPPRALSVRANVEFVPRAVVHGTACPPGSQVCLDILIPDTEARILVGTADLVIRPGPLRGELTPHLSIGAGIKHYSGGLSDTGVALHFGMGVELLVVEDVGLTLDVGDYVSWFDGFDLGEDNQTQRDLSATLGVRYGWF